MKIPSSSLPISLLAAWLLFGATAHAQTNAGLLGQRYVGLSLFTENIRDRDISNGNGGLLAVNLPLTPYLDFNASGSFESFRDYSIKDNRAFGGVTAYRDFNAFKLFADTSIGGTWQSSKVSGLSYSDKDGIYALGVGIEAPFTDRSALFGRVATNHYFKRDRGHYWTYAAGIDHWFTEKLGGIVTVTFFDRNSVTFLIGANVRF